MAQCKFTIVQEALHGKQCMQRRKDMVLQEGAPAQEQPDLPAQGFPSTHGRVRVSFPHKCKALIHFQQSHSSSPMFLMFLIQLVRVVRSMTSVTFSRPELLLRNDKIEVSAKRGYGKRGIAGEAQKRIYQLVLAAPSAAGASAPQPSLPV